MASMGMGPGLVVSVRSARHEWVQRHAVPLVASAVLLVAGMEYVTWWPALRSGHWVFWAPGDLWGTYLQSVALVHGHLPPSSLGMLGSLLVLAPVAVVGSALHLGAGHLVGSRGTPSAWALLGPWTFLVASSALFALDSVAARLGVQRRERMALGVVEALLLVNVTAKWGHPAVALALGLALYALLDLDHHRVRRGGLLLGAAVAVQPVMLLVVPAAAMLVWHRRGRPAVQRLVVRSLAPSVVLLVPGLAMHFGATLSWLVRQPGSPSRYHATPFTSLSAAAGHGGMVITGPQRLVGLVLAVGVAVWLCREATFRRCLWAVAAGFFVWAAVDSVLTTYDVWPVFAVAALVTARDRKRVWFGTVVLAALATWFSDVAWHGAWGWWGVMVVAGGVALAAAWHALGTPPREDQRSVTTVRDLAAPARDAGLAAAVSRRARAIVPPWTG